LLLKKGKEVGWQPGGEDNIEWGREGGKRRKE
jgi:hypothetical protein